jgi:uncharacterized protein YlxW (UPF0749 family)
MARHAIPKAPSWIGPVTLVALILGFLLASAWKVPKGSGVQWLYGGRPAASSPTPAGDSLKEREKEIKNLRDQLTAMQEAIADRSRQTKVLNESLQEAKLFAALTEVQGPGIEIILRDSKKKVDDPMVLNEYNIHDTDVLRVVNDVWMAGAEAVSINGQRLSKNASFRCEGNVIYVGRVPIASPVKISAIGNTETLFGALTMQGRYLDVIRKADPGMVEVVKKEKIVLPAYTGSTEMSYAKSVPAKP